MRYGKSIVDDGGYSVRKHLIETVNDVDGVAICGKDVPRFTMTSRATKDELCRFCLHRYKKTHGKEYEID